MLIYTSNLTPKNVRSYNLRAHTYMISYAQGNILKAFFPGAIMPGIFVNQDWNGLYSHIKESITAFIGSFKTLGARHKTQERTIGKLILTIVLFG